MTDSTPDLYPNADSDAPNDISRRSLLAGSAAVGTAVAAGCLEDGGDDSASDRNNGGDSPMDTEDRPTVFVFNTGDGSVSVIDVERDEVVETRAVGLSASFPSNQFTPGLTASREEPLWLNVDDGVRALSVGSLDERARVETGSGANWQERTPNGAHLIVSAREPVHRNLRIDADPGSETFGDVTATIDRQPERGRGENEGPGPCDVTIHPDGEYAYVPDLFGDTLTVLDVDTFEIATQITVESQEGVPPAPWMGTASWDGTHLLVEHDEGQRGSESLWDVSDPAEPVEVTRLGPDEGMGTGPLTSEIGPDSEVGYVFTPGTNDVTVVDLDAGEVSDRLDLGGSAFVGTWDPNREKLYVPVRTTNEVAVIDSGSREIVRRIEVGPAPYGATAATLRPAAGTEATVDAALGRIDGLAGTYATTYCIGECACGHEL